MEIIRVKSQARGGKTLTGTLSTINPLRTNLILNLSLQGERSATNRLSHDTGCPLSSGVDIRRKTDTPGKNCCDGVYYLPTDAQ